MINSRTIRISTMTLSLAVCSGASMLGGCGGTTTAQLPDAGVRTIASGSFTGFAGHAVTGEASLTESYGNIYLVLGDDFSLGNDEKARLGFGRDGEFDTSTRFTSLADTSGRQVYSVPASINPYDFDEVYVWGNTSREVLGKATLSRAPETLTGMFAPSEQTQTATNSTTMTSTTGTTPMTDTTDTQASVQTAD
ncbi:MAG: hypothetical protein ACI89L_000778 [Phycisphaerales bacterium]|jgi:hypothetical protein